MPYEVPSSLASLLSLFRPCSTAPTFETFCGLCVGLLTRVRGRTVTGMLIAAGLSGEWHHSRAHRFFSRARWSADRLGLVALGLIAGRLTEEGEPLVVAIDDTLLRRSGPKVFARQLHHDGSSPAAGPRAGRIAHGNAWVVAGVVVALPFLERRVCLPVLFRLWRPGKGPTQVAHAAELATLIAQAHPDRGLIVLADGAYAARALSPADLPRNVAVIARARRDLRLNAPPPPRRPGQVGKPAPGASGCPPARAGEVGGPVAAHADRGLRGAAGRGGRRAGRHLAEGLGRDPGQGGGPARRARRGPDRHGAIRNGPRQQEK